MVRWFPAVDLVRPGGRDGRYLLRPLVHRRHLGDDAHHRHLVPARNQGRGYLTLKKDCAGARFISPHSPSTGAMNRVPTESGFGHRGRILLRVARTALCSAAMSLWPSMAA